MGLLKGLLNTPFWAVVARIDQLEERLMAQFDDVKALIAALDAETTRIAAKLQELLDRLAAGGQTPEQEAEIFADLQALKARLDALGRDPEEPIPSA